MDKGAHFYKTDFQIHSPRDSGWVGDGVTQWPEGKPVSVDERLAFARRFIAKCRELGIEAVGVTDHHDMCFARYFQVAAQESQDASGVPDWDSVPVRPENQRPIIFPGVEVSLSVPCQCIVLLDADCDPTTQAELLQAIGIGNIHPDGQSDGPNVEPLQLTLKDLDQNIRDYASERLRGRYIILPHVGDGGYKTILRDGFHRHFAQMPCVGGYIEQDWEDHGKKWRLDGRDPNYGNKAIGVFQTSDTKREDFSELGSRNTWVKFAQPTAEALRQACLAKESRISQVAPTIPTKYIYRIEVSDSTFMGHVDFELNPQFNAFIGGRGTGKSTLLEYLRWAMQDQPVGAASDIELADGVAHKRRLIQDTLVGIGGLVTVYWSVDGVPHVVRCNSRTNELTLQVASGDPAPVTGEYVRGLLPVRAYSQKQLSSVSIRTAELQRFIEQPIQDELEKVEDEIAQTRDKLRLLYDDILRRSALERQLRGFGTTLASVRERVAALEKSLPKLSDKSQEALNKHADQLREKQAVEALRDDLGAGVEILTQAEKELSALPRELDIDPDSPQKDLLNAVHSKGATLFSEAVAGLKQLRSRLAQGSDRVMGELNKWAAAHEVHVRAYEAAQQEASAHKAKMNQIKDLRDQEAQTRKSISALEQQLKALPDPEKKFHEMWNAWCELHRMRGDLLEQQCADLSQKSAGDIRAALVRGADIEASMEKLNLSLKGAHILPEHWKALRKYLLGSGSVVEHWRELMFQLRPLAEAEPEDIPPGASPTPLASWDLTPNQLRAIVERLEPYSWLKVALTSLKDLPKFFYTGASSEIMFEKASAGQQATALLKVLLHESVGPLIIDQPEEDLDNAVVEQIVTAIWQAKQQRQIIVASHNANLVVNGDAELIIHCDYVADDVRSKGRISHLGSIDVQDIRDSITKVMEGGKRAFELRKEKYGF